MSLTYDDLQAIRKIVEETVSPVKGKLEALGNDIKEIYDMIANMQKNPNSKGSFSKLGIEQKILQLHSDLIEATKQAGVTLPSH
jgi:hypothetical protein